MLLKALNHPNIVSLESMHMDIKARLVCLVCWLHGRLLGRLSLGATSAKPWGLAVRRSTRQPSCSCRAHPPGCSSNSL